MKDTVWQLQEAKNRLVKWPIALEEGPNDTSRRKSLLSI
jgi:hypothetical protein